MTRDAVPGPVDETVAPQPIPEVPRPAWFTLMAPGWLPPADQITQAVGICCTADGEVVMVTWDDRQWTFPGGTVEPGETVEQALVREVAEEACATVLDYYQSRWWARVAVHPWRPAHEMTGRRLVAPADVAATLFWPEKDIAARLIEQALAAEERHRTPGSR
ncbi:MAG TPA: NUDIX domain-containing protein [Pseudonocardiaceae bacterium]|nr:NUDIX domain-containing protein [Pseudonocardiaceae bacterium]